MEVGEALTTLGIAPGAAWEDVRRAYRDQLMSHHPDVGDQNSSAERTEAIVTAFRTLRAATDDGATPLPQPLNLSVDDEGGPLVLYARPGDVFMRMCQAAENIGHVSYADRDSNLLQVTIGASGDADADGESGWAPSQLTAELRDDGAVTTALFSLEALGTAAAPPIGEVVARLADQLRAPAAID